MNSLSCVMAAGDGAGARVEATAQGLVGIHVPHAVLDSEAHGLVVEGLTEALRPVVPSNGARAADATDLALARIARGRPAGGNRTGGRVPARRRRRVMQGFVQPPVGVRLHPRVDDLRLAIGLRGCGLGGLRFEPPMPAFMGAVLWRTRGREAVRHDPARSPPRGEAMASVHAMRRHRGAGVAANGVGQAVVPEQTSPLAVDPIGLHVRNALAAQPGATAVIDDRPRLAVDAIPCAEVAVAIDGPPLSGCGRLQRRRARRRPVRARPSPSRASMVREALTDRAAGRPRDRGIEWLPPCQHRARAPTVACVLGEDQGDRLRRGFVRRGLRRATARQPSRHAEREESLAPVVAGVAKDAVSCPPRRHRPPPAREVRRDVMPRDHGIGLQPGHRQLSDGDSDSVHHVPGHV